MKTTPPLPLLETVEAVVRLGSFKRAADELLITPSAVSHRVKAVEEAMGKLLFNRVGQGVEPTPHARRIAEVVGAARLEIGKVWREVSAEAQGDVVKVVCMAAFAGNFILSRIDEFKRRFPTFDLELTSSVNVVRERRYDLIVGYGPRPEADWISEEILPLRLRPVIATGAYDAAFRDGKLFGPLLGYMNPVLPWKEAAARIGLELHPDARMVAFDSAEAASAAAESGVGVALAPSWIADRLVATGRVRALGEAIPTGASYWLAVKREQKGQPAYTSFRRWLLAKIVEGG